MADSLHALVVEDSPTMRQLIVFALSRIKTLRVVEADDGVDALKKLSQQHYDILITDINMPMLDGLKAFILEWKDGPDYPVLEAQSYQSATDPEAKIARMKDGR